jgi:hypothetical protein
MGFTSKKFLKIFFKIFIKKFQKSSVPYPGHFGVDPDPDPRVHASDKWIRILDPDPAIFVIDLQDTNKNLFKKFFCL